MHNALMSKSQQGKKRGQINLDADLMKAFVAECGETWKPGQLAAVIIRWYLRAPPYVKSVVIQGLNAVPEGSKEQAAKEIAEFLAGRSQVNARKTA